MNSPILKKRVGEEIQSLFSRTLNSASAYTHVERSDTSFVLKH